MPDATQAVVPQQQTGALTPQPTDTTTREQDVDSLATPPDMGSVIAQHQIEAGKINHGDSRDWAENAVAGVQAALAGFGAAGKVPPGAGWLYGVGAAARQGQEQQQQKQKMQLEQKRELTEEDRAHAEIALQNAQQLHIERMTRNEDLETQQKLVDSDIAAAEPYVDEGIRSYGEHLTSDDLQRMLKPGPGGKSEINGHEVIPFRDGMTDVIGRDGRPVLDPSGTPLRRPTYRLFDANGTVTLDEQQAKFIADNTPYHPLPGIAMPVAGAYSLQTLAKKNQAFDLNVQKVQAETGKDTAQGAKAEGETKSKADEDALKQQAAKLFTPYLSAANGDPWRAIQIMSKDPKNAGALGIVEQAYGPGAIDTWHKNQIDEQQKQEELALKKLDDQKTIWGNPDAATADEYRTSLNPEQRAAVDLVGQGRAPLNNPGYVIARNPAFIGAVAKLYPDVDLSKIGAYQEAYKKFVSGKQGDAVNAGGTAMEHLAELKGLNTKESMIPGTPAHTAYENKANTLTGELMNFYRISSTEANEKDLKSGLAAVTTWNRNAAIATQAKSMADKLDNYKQQWDNAAPSAAYEAHFPDISQKAKIARASLVPGYALPPAAQPLTATGPKGQKLILRNGQWVPAPAPQQ